MPIYLQFENGLQVETTTLRKKPYGWQKDHSDFALEKRYKLLEDGSIAERNESYVAQKLLQIHAQAH